MTHAQEWYLSWTVDLLVYTVVLNLFDEYVEGVVIESFTISIRCRRRGLLGLEVLRDAMFDASE